MAKNTTNKKGSEKKKAGNKINNNGTKVVTMQVSADVVRRLVSKLEEKGI